MEPLFIGTLMSSILQAFNKLCLSAFFCSSLVSVAVICFWMAVKVEQKISNYFGKLFFPDIFYFQIISFPDIYKVIK